MLPLALTALVLLLTGCARALVPAPGAELAPGRGQGAVGRDAGVVVTARVGAWAGYPRNLEQAVLPILAEVDNGSTVPIRLRYEHFTLLADGERLVARGPYELDGVVYASPPAGYAYPRFSLGVGAAFGSYRGWGLGLGLGLPLHARDPFWWDDYYYPLQVPVRLPSGDMVQQALPERTLEPGEQVSGFLYFDRLPRGARLVTFAADLVDARTGETFGGIVIPFVRD